MKKLIAVISIFLCSCATYTMITGTWTSPSFSGKTYNSMLVAVLTDHTVNKTTIENELQEQLNKEGIRAFKSADLFSPRMNGQDSDKVSIMKKAVQGKKAEAILTVSILKKETETRYVPSYGYNPDAYCYYGSFRDYFSYWYPYTYSPAYYAEPGVYYLETNLYDSKTEELVWSAQSRTYKSVDLPSFSKEFAKETEEKLKKEGLIKIVPPADDAISGQ